MRELVADKMTVANIRLELEKILKDDVPGRKNMLAEYERMLAILGPAGASCQAASQMCKLLEQR